MKSLHLAIVFVVVASIASNGQADLKKLDAYYAKALKDWNVPGMAIGIVKDGKVVFMKGYGVKEVGKTEVPDENTLFAIASITKAFTTTTFTILEKEKKLSLDDKVRSHLPYFELYNPYVSNDATLRDLLCHRVGHATFSGDIIWCLSDNLPAEQIVRRARYLPQSYNYRAGYGYSNIMYIAAGEVLRKVTGQNWAGSVRSKILEPLGMSRTITSVNDLSSKGNFASPHGWVDKKSVVVPWENWDAIGPTGGMISSVKDMTQWLLFNLGNGTWGSDTLITKSQRNELWRPHNNFSVDNTDPDNDTHFRSYGLGWFLTDYKGRLRVAHTGGYMGMVSNLVMIPDEKFGIIVLTNSINAGGLMNAIANYTVDSYLGSAKRDWSAEYLTLFASRTAADTRVQDRLNSRVQNTKPSLSLDKYAGNYVADVYGTIEVKKEGETLRMYFEHTKRYHATLEHWHYNVWKLKWDNAENDAWFPFASVQFKMDNNNMITELEFDVPNDDFWFYELKPKRKQ